MNSVDSTKTGKQKSSNKMLPPLGRELRASDFTALHATIWANYPICWKTQPFWSFALLGQLKIFCVTCVFYGARVLVSYNSKLAVIQYFFAHSSTNSLEFVESTEFISEKFEKLLVLPLVRKSHLHKGLYSLYCKKKYRKFYFRCIFFIIH